MKITLQVPVDKSLKTASAKVAKEYGFSSLQEVVRLFLTQLANRTVTVRLAPGESDEFLTSKQEEILTKKYLQAKKDIKEGKSYTAKHTKEMVDHLRRA